MIKLVDAHHVERCWSAIADWQASTWSSGRRSIRVPLLCCQIGNLSVQTDAQIEGGLIKALAAGLSPQVELVALGLAFEAVEDVAAKMCREGAVLASRGRFMEGT